MTLEMLIMQQAKRKDNNQKMIIFNYFTVKKYSKII